MGKEFGENLNATGDQSNESTAPNPKITLVPPAPDKAKEALVQQITTHTTALVAGIALGYILAKYLSK